MEVCSSPGCGHSILQERNSTFGIRLWLHSSASGLTIICREPGCGCDTPRRKSAGRRVRLTLELQKHQGEVSGKIEEFGRPSKVVHNLVEKMVFFGWLERSSAAEIGKKWAQLPQENGGKA